MFSLIQLSTLRYSYSTSLSFVVALYEWAFGTGTKGESLINRTPVQPHSDVDASSETTVVVLDVK